MNEQYRIQNIVERLERRYSPENDIIPGAPDVTKTDIDLLEAIKDLVLITENLQEQVDRLNGYTTR
jgi:hypothetical protein